GKPAIPPMPGAGAHSEATDRHSWETGRGMSMPMSKDVFSEPPMLSPMAHPAFAPWNGAAVADAHRRLPEALSTGPPPWVEGRWAAPAAHGGHLWEKECMVPATGSFSQRLSKGLLFLVLRLVPMRFLLYQCSLFVVCCLFYCCFCCWQ
ncbi:unnamed protein product, partial [Polarella glacialis]